MHSLTSFSSFIWMQCGIHIGNVNKGGYVEKEAVLYMRKHGTAREEMGVDDGKTGNKRLNNREISFIHYLNSFVPLWCHGETDIGNTGVIFSWNFGGSLALLC